MQPARVAGQVSGWSFPCFPCRVELEDVRDHLQREEVGRVGVVQELNVLREKHQSEMVAAEHAHKLAK